jgi:hypothetical protein
MPVSGTIRTCLGGARLDAITLLESAALANIETWLERQRALWVKRLRALENHRDHHEFRRRLARVPRGARRPRIGANWRQIAAFVTEAYRTVAPAKLAAAIGPR